MSSGPAFRLAAVGLLAALGASGDEMEKVNEKLSGLPFPSGYSAILEMVNNALHEVRNERYKSE